MVDVPSGQRIEDVWLLLLWHLPEDCNGVAADPARCVGVNSMAGFYPDSDVLGLEIDPMVDGWTLFQPEGFDDVFYLGFPLGNLDEGDVVEVPIEYRVSQALFQQSANTYKVPDLAFNYITTSVPEPAAALLLGAAGLALGLRRRR